MWWVIGALIVALLVYLRIVRHIHGPEDGSVWTWAQGEARNGLEAFRPDPADTDGFDDGGPPAGPAGDQTWYDDGSGAGFQPYGQQP